jgi:acyl-coenzyme A synthetase/AMP-(fatty) acid ligase
MGGDLPNVALPKQFIVVPELPKMPSGKIDYRNLTEAVRDLVHRT